MRKAPQKQLDKWGSAHGLEDPRSSASPSGVLSEVLKGNQDQIQSEPMFDPCEDIERMEIRQIRIPEQGRCSQELVTQTIVPVLVS